MYTNYLQRFGYGPPKVLTPPVSGLGLVVVIPSFKEPALVQSLQSLWKCTRPTCAVEIQVVINSSETASESDLSQNQRSFEEATAWAGTHDHTSFRTHIIYAPNLPRRHAGVGLARKIGMDEAICRLAKPNGIIACFDADSTCDPNYLTELERYFCSSPNSPGCSIYFEHPIEGAEAQAITLYELHLRYYVEALRYARFPHAYHTIGSSMAVRADAYMKQGGMNKRQAGEDFYFLHKIIPLGNFGELNTTRVIPSPRVSDRVPFGTGKAVRDYLASGEFVTYPIEAFVDLRSLFAQVPSLFESPAKGLSEPLVSFLSKQGFEEALGEIRSNTANVETFAKRFFRWFDGFLAMKYVHYARDHAYGAPPVDGAAHRLLDRVGRVPNVRHARELLENYRVRQRHG